MTNRYQNQRSTTSGNLPASGTRLPGEIWVNFPDLQLGLIDASKTPQKLIAVRYFSTTATYAAGDMVVQAGAIYVANGAVPPGAFTAAQWTKVSTAADLAGYLALAGGTMTGPIVWVTGNSINGAAGTARSLFGTTALSKRWELQLGGPSAEGGANAGSNFNLIAYNDAGAVLSTPMSIARATGAVTFGSSVTIPSLTLTALDNTPIGQTTPAAGSFTALTATSLNGGPLAGQRNRIMNGDMRIDQRNAGAVINPTANAYPADRWFFVVSQGSKFSLQAVSPGPPGFASFLALSVATGFASAAGDNFQVLQRIEGLNVADLQFGTTSATPVTLSFSVYTSKTGTHSGAIQNGAGNRSYPFTFSVPTANTWTKIAVTIPGDTAGTWAVDNTTGLCLTFNLGCGSTYLGPAGSWQAGNIIGATGAVNIVATTGTSFFITGVQLEPGSVATPFERRLYGAELALCQRYYQRYTTGGIYFSGYTSAGPANWSFMWPCPQMRSAPTLTIIGTWNVTNCSQPAASIPASPYVASFYVQATTTGSFNTATPANTGFDLAAEL